MSAHTRYCQELGSKCICATDHFVHVADNLFGLEDKGYYAHIRFAGDRWRADIWRLDGADGFTIAETVSGEGGIVPNAPTDPVVLSDLLKLNIMETIDELHYAVSV